MSNHETAELLQPEDRAVSIAQLGDKIIGQLRTVFDPEIPVNIYDLGLIYRIDVKPEDDANYVVDIDMTLTTPNCPVAEEMPARVKTSVEALPEVKQVIVNLLWEPPWDKSMMSDEARLQLNMF